jgi:hypothetical protein
VKFRSETQSAPDSFNHTNSELQPLGSLTFFVADNESLELPVDISFQYSIDPSDSSRLNMETVTVNGASLGVNATTITWNTAKNGFYGNLFFELWIYNRAANAFEYHQRYVSLWFRLNP